MKFCVNLSVLFTELPLLERPAAAAELGFSAVEFWPFDSPQPADRELDRFAAAIEEAGVQLAGLNFDGGDMAHGDRGLLSVPGQSDRFRVNIEVAVGLTDRLSCRVLNALYGNRVEGIEPAVQDRLAVQNLALAGEAAGRIGATAVVEGLNSFESPRYPLTRTRDVLGVIERVRETTGVQLKCLYDAYHMQRMEGNLIATVTEHADKFGHVQIADPPGRNQPGTGEVAWDRVLDALAATGYGGDVGLEYGPTGDSADSFAWLPGELRAGWRMRR